MPAERRFDVLVAGAGPAGIAAACAAAESGRSVGVVDDNPAAGGQIWRGGDLPRDARRWLERFGRSGAELIAGTRLIDRVEHHVLLAESDNTALAIAYEKLILATGARERFLPFAAWTLPNVMGAGGLQALVKGGLPIRGQRVVVAGTGPLLLAVAAYLRQHGALVPVIAEQAPWSRVARFGLALETPKLVQALGLRLDLLGSRYRTGCWPVAAEGDGAVNAVILRSAERTWRVPCDYLACGFGLVPNLELPLLVGCEVRDGFVAVNEWQEASATGVYCAGEPTGIAGLDLALTSGLIAGYSAAGPRDQACEYLHARDRTRRFRRALDRAFALRDELKTLATPDTTVCRCEDVTLGRIRTHHSWRSAKLQTRCGMGPCQGRVCGPAVEFLLGWTPESVRGPILPARVDHLSGAHHR